MFSALLLRLTKKLYPTGRAFKMPEDSLFERLHKALIVKENQLLLDSLSLFDSILPDNDNFTTDDATDWERRLGLITDTSVPLADRILLIRRKINHPGTITARQNYLYLQEQLRSAGFDVYVYENIPEVALSPVTEFQFGDIEFGDGQFGGAVAEKIVNSITQDGDSLFDVGVNLRSVFYIGGNTLGSYANVPLIQEAQFRQLVLRLKPVQEVAYLLINYV